MDYELDCKDNSCLFVLPEKRTGMRTNGSCRCLKNLGLSPQQERPIRFWAINAHRAYRLAALREVLQMNDERFPLGSDEFSEGFEHHQRRMREGISAIIKREEEGSR